MKEISGFIEPCWECFGSPSAEALNDVTRIHNGELITIFKKGNKYKLEDGPDHSIQLAGEKTKVGVFVINIKCNGEFTEEFIRNFRIIEDGEE